VITPEKLATAEEILNDPETLEITLGCAQMILGNFSKFMQEVAACREAIQAADALAKDFEWVKQTVHRAHHEGPLEGCKKNTCDAARKALAAYEKVRGL